MSLQALGNRLLIVLNCFENRKEASSIAGISIDQLNAYTKGKNAPPFLVIARLAVEARVSLDWLATGRGDMRPGDLPLGNADRLPQDEIVYDEELLIEIIQTGEEFIRRGRFRFRNPAAKARMIATLYRHACRRRRIGVEGDTRRLRGLAEIDLQAIEELMRLLK